MIRRRRRNEVLIWITLLLLQECQVCLMMNLQNMKKDKQSIQTKTKTYINEKEEFHDVHLMKRQVNDHSDAYEVMVAVQNAGELYKETYPNWAENIKDKECNSSNEEMTRKVWSENESIVLSLYLSSYAVMSYLKGCIELMQDQVELLIAKVGKADALDHIEQVVDILKNVELASADEEEEEEDDFDDDGDNTIDPEGQEISTLNEATYLISRNIHVTESLSDIFLSFNDSSKPAKSIDGLDGILDDSINEYLVISSMMQEAAQVRQKRSIPPKSPIESLNLYQYQRRAIEGHTYIAKRSVRYSRVSHVDQVLKHHADIMHSPLFLIRNQQHNKVSQLSKHFDNAFTTKFASLSNLVRNRRQISTENLEIIFIKNVKFPCMLLTFQGGEMFFSNFDEISIYSQLWILNDGHLQHYQTGFFLTQTTDGKIHPKHLSNPVTKFQVSNGTITVSETLCKITTNKHANKVTLQTDCNTNNKVTDWTLVTLLESQTDIATITCLFFIQKHDSCKALTYKTPTLVMSHINEENIINQLWYWDHEYIRHSRTHKYLTSDWTDSPLSLVGLNEGLNQRWKMRNDTLVATDLPHDNVMILGDETVRVGSKDENIRLDWNISLEQLHKDGLPACKNTDYFALTHDDIPCLVMCATEMEAEHGLLIKVLVIGLALLTGISSSFLFCICFQAKEALIAGIVVGIIMAAVAAFVLYVPRPLTFKYLTVHFDEFNDSESENCLWLEDEGGIKNMKHDKFLSLETVGSNDFKTLRLIAESDQHLSFKNKVNKQEDNLCELALIMDTFSRTSSGEALHFECKEEFENIVKWTMIKLSESVNFVEQTSCLYFLRLKNNPEDSCSVLTTDTVSNEVLISTKRPAIDQLFKQLWFLRGDVYLNLYSGDKINISASDIDTRLDKVAFTDKESELGTFGYCERTLYFIKSRENPCLLMTYMNASGEEYYDFQEYNVNHVMDQLWENQENGLINAISGYHAASYNFTPAESVIFTNDFTSYADKIVCPFFVQEKEPTCLLLTANTNNRKVFFGPLTSDLVESQLWYRSGTLLVHLQTGMSLRFSGSFIFQLATLADKTIPVANVTREEGNNTLIVQSGMYNTSISWRQIHAVEALDDLSMFQCSYSNRTFYFIKQTSSPCLVLTSGNMNEPPVFDTFNEKNVPSQLWYEENERIINLYSGLVWTMNAATGKYAMTPHLFYEPLQNVEISNKVNGLWTLENMNYNCSIKPLISKDSVEIVCTAGTQNNAAFEFIGYNALDDISNLLCLFYIRSKKRPCEFLTGYSEGSFLKIRPMTEQLIQQQLFYSKGNYIVHQKSGLLLTYRNRTLGLQRGPHMNSYQSWEFNVDFLEIRNGNNNLALTYDETDGHAYVTDLDRNVLKFYWSKVTLDYDFESDASKNPYCSEDIDIENMNVFFITSTRETCVVLTAERLGKVPEFKVFDNNNQNFQLWFFSDKHIINLATGLAIMVQFDEFADEHDVVMWNKYTFATAQKFYLTDGTFEMPLENKTCVLSSIKTDTSVSINLDCEQHGPTDLRIVHFDNEGEHLNLITCFFFIKSLLSPCELLTFDNDKILLRPLSGEFYEGQLWYWKETKLINAKSNRMLSAILGKFVSKINLQPIATTRSSNIHYHWSFENGLIKPIEKIGGLSLAIGFWIENGTISIKPFDFNRNWYRQWTFVNRDEGLKQAEKNMFHCGNNVKLDYYVIRSEHDNCPLLNVVGGSKVGYLKVDDSGRGIGDAAWWTWHEEHVCNAQKQLCLAVNGTSRHTPDLEPRYAFDSSQRWTRQDGLIKNIYGMDKLTYTGSQIQLSSAHQGSKKQVWKWLKSSQIEDDPKHLRCSRCYNKGEETAAEIISYIPIFSFFYNIGRSIVYGVKKCPSVALGALRDALIDIAIDAIMILSAGTASAFALGIKTAVKLGFKAGMKAFANAIKSMVKVAIKSFGKKVVQFVKTGFRRTLKHQITKMKLNIKLVVSSLKRIPSTIKTFSKTTLRNVKSFVKVSSRSMTTLGKKTKLLWENGLKATGLKFKETFKLMPDMMKKQLNKQSAKLKNKLSEFVDNLSKKAEKAIKKSDELKMPKKIRCKRSPMLDCTLDEVGDSTLSKLNIMQKYQDDMIPLVPSKFQKDMAEINLMVAKENRQASAIGLRVDGKDALSSKDYAKISKDGLLDNTGNLVKDSNGHTEPYLLKKLDPKVKKHCSHQHPCLVYLFTKMSPCHERNKINNEQNKDCLSVISETCTTWQWLYSTKCVVSFEKVYKTTFPFSRSWTDVLKQTVKEGKFPSMTKNGMRDIDEVLKNRKNTQSLSSVVESDFKEILKEERISNKMLELYQPNEIPTNFGNFYENLNKQADTLIKKELTSIDVDAVFKNNKLKPDELETLEELKRKMIEVEDNINYKTWITKTFDDFSKVNNPTMTEKGSELLMKILNVVNNRMKNNDEIVNAIVIQVKSRLNANAGKAEATKIILEAAKKAGDAVSIYRFRPSG